MDFINHAKKTAANDGPYVSAIIVAAGRSVRMGTGKSKQFLSLCGIPAIARTLSAFEKSKLIREVIIVTNRFDIVRMGGTVKEFGFEKVKGIVVGGETRQQSAALGFNAIDKKSEFVAVHDGARPLVTSGCIDRAVESAFHSGAAALAVRVKDTVKIADENSIVISTPDRERLWAVQTPQVFGTDLYRCALETAVRAGKDYTDDCQIVEAAEGRVQLVEGDYTNIKLTTAEDIFQAEAIIKERGDAF
ncbi:MAG TPA: 2-C-methyl-D-erythritol 4-phosphate cytidylyltransferase [Ruminiclostridium sp.]|nr:2-C-methyl-D-erythritol 4-phosphate cytidylyltransferase [Ruminiclostridium sp.]